jgi:hypothetical protein
MIGRKCGANGGRIACRKMLAYAYTLPDVHTDTHKYRAMQPRFSLGPWVMILPRMKLLWKDFLRSKRATNTKSFGMLGTPAISRSRSPAGLVRSLARDAGHTFLVHVSNMQAYIIALP